MNKHSRSDAIPTDPFPNPVKDPVPIRRVVLVNPLSKGNLGKTTFYGYLTNTLEEGKISWAGANMDGRHRTFQEAHPANVLNYFQEGVQAVDEYHPVFRDVRRSQASVYLIDQRAQADAVFLEAARRTHFLKNRHAHGIRIVPICVAINDLDYLRNVTEVVEAFAEEGIKRWIVVSHRELHKDDVFMRTPLRRRLEAEGAAIIEMPWLSHVAMQRYAGLNATAGGPYSFGNAIKHPIMLKEDLCVAEFEDCLVRMGKQFREHQKLILPDGMSFTPLVDLSTWSPHPVSPTASWPGVDDLSEAFLNDL